MNAALNRPALNATILVSVIFHLAVLYYLATAFHIIPPIEPQQQTPPAISVYTPPPPPPVIKKDELPPIVAPHHLDSVRQTEVPPVPLAPQHVDESQPRGPLTLDHTIDEQPTSMVQPLYPHHAIEAEKEGHVRLSITILPDGSVTDVQVISAQPAGYFEQSAVDAVRRWHYAPSAAPRIHVYVDVFYQLAG